MLSRRFVLVVCLLVPGFFSCVSMAESEERETLDPSLSRMYPVSSAEALEALKDVLVELGVKIREVENETGRLESKKMRVKKGRFEGLSVPLPKSSFGGSKIKFESFYVYAFVSPYVEPARVHVTSRINFVRFKPQMDLRRDHLPELSAWVLDALDRKLGVEGAAIPVDHAERFALARRLLGESGAEVPACLEEVPQQRLVSLLPESSNPKQLAGFSPKLRYPQPDLKRENDGRVVLSGWLFEDGYFWPAALDSNSTDTYGQLAVVAYQFSRYQRFRPQLIEGCPAPRTFRYSVDFFVKWKDTRQPLN